MIKVQNSDIAQKFNQVADLLEIEGANPFRIKAYRNAARTLLALSESVADTVHNHGDLSVLPGIGKDLSSKIEEVVETGHLSLLDSIEKKTPLVLRELLKIPNIGPKKVQLLYNKLGVKTLRDLQKVAENKKILELRGFGKKTREGILTAINKRQTQPKPRIPLNVADDIANNLLQYLRKNKKIQQITVAGSYRRRQDTVGDLDILATSDDNAAVMKYFLNFSEIAEVLSHGETRSTVILRNGAQVDLRVVTEDSYGAALLYFTGSKAHNIALRSMALKQQLKINEYGIYKGKKRLASYNEEDIYRILRLPYIEPELRENTGELTAAINGHLPKLITKEDLKGDLHSHTSATDGLNSIVEMAQAAQKMGYDYIAVTDHTQHLTVAHGLSPEKLLEQIKEIDRINTQLVNFTVLKSSEVDILKDGSLDISDEILTKLDLTVCAIHSHFNLTREKQSLRIIRAMQNPNFRILGHPTGRLIGAREAYDIDMEKVIKAAAHLNRVLEVNSQPDRLDLTDRYCRMAKDHRVKMAISSDAHSLTQLNLIDYGIGQARRGWLEKQDVINTLPLKKLKEYLK